MSAGRVDPKVREHVPEVVGEFGAGHLRREVVKEHGPDLVETLEHRPQRGQRHAQACSHPLHGKQVPRLKEHLEPVPVEPPVLPVRFHLPSLAPGAIVPVDGLALIAEVQPVVVEDECERAPPDLEEVQTGSLVVGHASTAGIGDGWGHVAEVRSPVRNCPQRYDPPTGPLRSQGIPGKRRGSRRSASCKAGHWSAGSRHVNPRITGSIHKLFAGGCEIPIALHREVCTQRGQIGKTDVRNAGQEMTGESIDDWG